MHSGPVIVGFDGTPTSERAVCEAAALLAPRPALVVVVWEAGRAFDIGNVPTGLIEFPPVVLDVRTAFAIDQEMLTAAERLARHGARLATEAGLKAEGLAVAEEASVADTLVRLAHERDSQAVVVGAHSHGRISELLLGSTSRAVLRHAPCPVMVIPAEADGHRG